MINLTHITFNGIPYNRLPFVILNMWPSLHPKVGEIMSNGTKLAVDKYHNSLGMSSLTVRMRYLQATNSFVSNDLKRTISEIHT